MLGRDRIALLSPATQGEVCRQAGKALAASGMVVVPTETFYGLAVDAGDELALERLVDLKTRAAHKPIPLIASSAEAVIALAVLPPPFARLADRFWPGPLTLAVTPRRPVSAWLLSPVGTIGVRVSGHVFARALAAASSGGLITSTSANLAGAPPPRSISELAPPIAAAAALVVDAGACPGGAPSTVVGLQGERVVVLRAGAVAPAELASVLGYPPAVTREPGP